MGFSFRRKRAGLNFQFQKRGLRLQKQLKAGPFQWNIGTYFGGTHHGKITTTQQAAGSGLSWRKNDTIADFQGDKTNESLNEFFDVNQNLPDYELEDENQIQQWTFWDPRTFFVMVIITLFLKMFLQPWIILVGFILCGQFFINGLVQHRSTFRIDQFKMGLFIFGGFYLYKFYDVVQLLMQKVL